MLPFDFSLSQVPQGSKATQMFRVAFAFSAACLTRIMHEPPATTGTEPEQKAVVWILLSLGG
jgi:hypothetical protein